MADIFISYARENRDQVEKLARLLEVSGFSLWWDRQLESGAEFSRDIERALDASKIVLVVWSASAATSPWVRDEAAQGRDQGKLVPIRLDASPVPIGFRQFQAADLSRWNGGASAEIDNLARSLQRRIDADPPATHSAAAPAKRTTKARLAVYGAAAALGAVAIAVSAQYLVRNSRAKEALDGVAATQEVLARPGATPAAAMMEQPTVAILPFANFSNEADQAYFADGMTEEILNVLSRIEGLRVTSRTSSFAFKGSKAGIAEIARALNVRHVLEGSVRKSGTTLRITAQLIDAQTDKHVWSRTFDRPYSADNMLAIQDEIAAAIVKEMAASFATSSTLVGTTPAYVAPATVMTRSTEAYEAYLRGSQLVEQRTKQSLLAGIEDLNRAVSIDPGFAQAYAKLADAQILASDRGVHNPRGAQTQAANYADRALALAPDSAEALAAKAFVEFVADRQRAAIAYGERAIWANPNYVPGYKRLASALSTTGRMAEALTVLENAKAIDPLNQNILASIANTLFNIGKLDAAARAATENNQLYPKLSDAVLAGVLYTRGDFPEAHRLLKGLEADSPSSGDLNALWRLYANVGLTGLAKTYADSWDEAAYSALAAGDRIKALALAKANAEDKKAYWQGPGWVAYAAGDHATSYRIFRGDFDKVFDRQDPVIGAFRSGYAIAMLAEFERAGDPDAAIVRKALAKFFDGKALDDFTYHNQISGAVWKALNGDADGAIAWLAACADRGAVFTQIGFLPEFDAIRSRPDFLAVAKKMNANAARHRAVIEAQLAAPDPGWIKP